MSKRQDRKLRRFHPSKRSMTFDYIKRGTEEPPYTPTNVTYAPTLLYDEAEKAKWANVRPGSVSLFVSDAATVTG